MITALIPTKNEMNNDYFKENIKTLKSLTVNTIIVDGHSNDGSIEWYKKNKLTYYLGDRNCRAERINLGIQKSSKGLIFLIHPRTLITKESLLYLIKNHKGLQWGAFTHSFDSSKASLKFASWYSNKIRGDLKSIFYLDHCLFLQKNLFEKMGPLPKVDIFEDTILSNRLKKLHTPKRVPLKLTTSAIRFTKNGILKQTLINQFLKIKFFLNFDLNKMNRDYEKDLNLNGHYDE